MNVAMTLLARDEADLVDAHIAFHLNLGVDFVIATDNRSEDGTTDILERYEREGVLRLIREDGDDLRQSEWVTRMARLAASEHGADWVLNADADEFWWPRVGALKEILAAIPERFGVVRGAWRNFVPRPEGEPFFAERMTIRLCTPNYLEDPMAVVSKSVHRAVPDVRVGRGNHEAFAAGLVPLRGWYPIEIFHFPVRSREQCRRKYVTQYLALSRNPDKGTPGQIVEAYHATLEGRFDEFYEPLVVHDEELGSGLARGDLASDTRLRDFLRSIADGRGGFRTVRDDAPAPEPPRPPVEEDALFAAEATVIPETDVAQALEERLTDLERRIAYRERTVWPARKLSSLRRRYGPAG